MGVVGIRVGGLALNLGSHLQATVLWVSGVAAGTPGCAAIE